MSVGFEKDKSPGEMVRMFREHFGEWTVEMGKPTHRAAADYLNSRGVYSARGCVWTEGTLVMALRRYGLTLTECVPAGMEFNRPTCFTTAAAVNREIRQQNNEFLHEQLLKWAKRYTLKMCPTTGKMAAELNEADIPTRSGKMWSHSTVTQTLQALGYDGKPYLLLTATGWVLGQGRSREDLEVYETELRREAMRPRYDSIVSNGLDHSSQLPLQLSLVKNFEGLTEEEAVLKYTVLPWDTLEAVALSGG